MKYRKQKKGEELEVARIGSQAFNFKLEIDKYTSEVEKGEHKPDNGYVAENDDGKLVAAMVVLPHKMLFDGHSVKSGGIGFVASLPEHRRGGNIRKIFEVAMQDMYDNDYTFSYLYPFSWAYYRKYGYELGTINHQIKVQADKLYRYRQEGHAEVYEKGSDPKDIKKVYKEYSSRYNLMLDRDDDLWKGYLDKDRNEHLQYVYVWYDKYNMPIAYVIYRLTDIQGEYNKNLNVMDIAFTSKEGLLAILGFLGHLAGNTKEVTLELPGDIEIDAVFPELWDVEVKRSFLGMNRIVNVKKALTLMKKPENSGEVTIKCTDDFFTANNDTYIVSWENGETTVESTENDPNITCSVMALSQLVTGYKTIKQCQYRDDFELNNSSEMLVELFVYKPTYIGDYF